MVKVVWDLASFQSVRFDRQMGNGSVEELERDQISDGIRPNITRTSLVAIGSRKIEACPEAYEFRMRQWRANHDCLVVSDAVCDDSWPVLRRRRMRQAAGTAAIVVVVWVEVWRFK